MANDPVQEAIPGVGSLLQWKSSGSCCLLDWQLQTTSKHNPGSIPSDAVKGGPNPSEDTSDGTGFGTDIANQKANYTAGTAASERSEELTERAKQTLQDLWGTAKETVVRKEDVKESVKESAAKVERSINSKN